MPIDAAWSLGYSDTRCSMHLRMIFCLDVVSALAMEGVLSGGIGVRGWSTLYLLSG